MGTGDYICVTLRGGAPWGFTLREGEGDTYRPFLVSQVEEGGRAFLAGVQEGDEVVSLNGEPCADLTLLRALALIDTSLDCLQLLVKRYCTIPPEDYESEETFCGRRDSSGAALESTTLHIFSSKPRSQSPRELYISESHDEAYCGELDSDSVFPKGPQLLCTELHCPSSGIQRGRVPVLKENDEEVQRCFSPGDMVELQVSFSEQTLDDVGCTSLGSAVGLQGEFSNREAIERLHSTTTSHSVPCSVREPLGQRGVVLSSPLILGQVEVVLQEPAASGAGRGILGVGGPRVSGSGGSQSEGEGGGHCKGVPGSLTVSFGIPSEEATPAEEQDSDSEGDQDKPNKHRARHARLRRSESLSEKQVKEAKSKCKRIALLLTAAPPNPNNKGLLMFKKHRQRAKKYTLVSYGTGEDETEYSDEDDEENEGDKQETHTVEFTLVPSEIDKHFLPNAQSSKGVLTINWDKGLLEIERNLNNKTKMECLPETKGKGALMFAQRRQRMDEISAEHEELRSHGMPVEGVLEAEKKTVEHSYMQSTTEGHAYMDVNIHQQSQQQQQYQQQYYEQQQNYQQQQYQQQYQQQQQQQQQYEQQHYQQQQMYQQQQEYHQAQQQMQHYSTNINGTVQHQTGEMQSSFSNRTAKPFSVENIAATPYSAAMSGTNHDSVGQGEQIASRDERISTPAIKTGLLMDARKRNSGKPMFTFKEAPKVSPNPALLNLLNRSDKKLGFESGPEEDYLSLGAEACNFLQSAVKHKTPPPVAPKPLINPSSLPWSPQIEVTNQDMSQQAQNSVSTPAVAPTTESTPAPELEPTPAPAPEPSPPPAPQEVPASSTTEEPHTWPLPEPESQQQPLQVTAQQEYGHMNANLQPEPVPVTSWAAAQTQAQQQPSTNSWHPSQVEPQEPPPTQSPKPQPWVTGQPTQTQVQPQTPTNAWTPPNQPSWSQPQEHAQSQPPWAHSHEQPNLQQMQPTWGQLQDQPMQPQAPWAQPSQTHSQHQPPWVQQPQQKSQAQPSWVQQVQPESQQQPPWVQQSQHQAPQQAWPQAQAPSQPQPPWVSTQPQQQPSINAWPPSQTQAQIQPPWIQAAQAQPPVQPQANLNPWAPVPVQAQSQPSWAQHPSEHGQQPMSSWAQEQNQAQHQAPWAQPVPPQPAPQPNWQQSTSKTSPQPPMNSWPSAQTEPQTPVNAWAPQSQQTPVNVNVSTSVVNTRPSPKPWHPPQNAPQNRTPPPPPQRMHSFTVSQRASSPINPMATVLNPSSLGSAFEMPVIRGKGADMFAKRQSRMEKFVVDSETVQANKASRSTSPTASLPNEWKYTPNVRAPPPRAYNPIQSPSYPPAATKQPPPSSPSIKAKKKDKEQQKPAPKPLNVIDVMKHQPYQLNSSLFTFGPAAEAAKPPAPKPDCSPPNPPVENQPIRYEQVAPVQPAVPFNAPYPQQAYGMPMQPMMHDGHYQQNPVYPPSNPYQQPPGGPYQQVYNQQYQQPAPPAYHPQAPQSPNPPYQQAPQALGRSYSLSPPARIPSTGQKSASASSSPKPPARASETPPPRQTSWLEKVHKPISPWEAASRHPMGLVDEAFTFQNLQQTLASNVRLAAQRKMLPEPPVEWKARVSYQAPQKTGSHTWSQNQSQSRSQSRAPLPSFVSPTRSTVSTPATHAGYRSLPRQWQPQRSSAQANAGPSVSYSESKRPLGKQTYKSVYTSNTWSLKRGSHVTVLHHDNQGEENAGGSNLQGGSRPGRTHWFLKPRTPQTATAARRT
ncbi:synaptopodin-2 [Chaetodon auriga]|uniref:synaptopodin-2 n=1 Tax=Chaetodon auriga TaxID=39042 RepID=UPI004032C558